MSELQMLAVAYVFFIALIGVELGISRLRRDGGYRFGEAVVNIGHGVVYQVFDHLTKALIVVPYFALAGLVTWKTLPMDAWWGWLVGLLLYDLATYWVHRHHHEIHFLWAIHGTHHAAEDYNLAAALRQPAFQNVFGWLWRLPLALIVPFEMLVGIVVFDFLYQFLQHTRYIPALGPVGLVMNTPSHHRVHHGKEAKYLDRNYGGIFIIWDRLFGTFQAEEEEPTYGVTRPVGSLNAVWGNLAIFAQIHRAARTTSGRDRLRIWLSGPGDLARLAPRDTFTPPPLRRDNDTPLAVRAYVLLTAMTIPPVLGFMLLTGSTWSVPVTAAVCAGIIASVACAGGLLEGKGWAVPVEAARLVAITAAACAALGALWPAALGAVSLGGLGISQRVVLARSPQPAAK